MGQSSGEEPTHLPLLLVLRVVDRVGFHNLLNLERNTYEYRASSSGEVGKTEGSWERSLLTWMFLQGGQIA